MIGWRQVETYGRFERIKIDACRANSSIHVKHRLRGPGMMFQRDICVRCVAYMKQNDAVSVTVEIGSDRHVI